MLESNGLKIFKVQKTKYHGGSIRIYCSLNNQSINDYEKFIIEEEKRNALTAIQTETDLNICRRIKAIIIEKSLEIAIQIS